MRSVTILLAGAAFAASPAHAADQLKSGPAPAWVIPQVIPSQSTKAADAPVAILLNDSQVRVEADRSTSFSELAIKIQRPEGLSAGNISFPWQPATDTITINKLQIIRGGTIIDVLKGGQTFTIARRETNLDAATLDGTLTANIQPEGLQVGDIINLALTDEHFDPVMKGHFEGVFGAWGAAPVEQGHVKLSWPDNKKITTRELELPQPTRSSRDGFDILELSARSVDPVILPDGAPARFRLGRGGEASDFSTWDQVARLMEPLFDNAAVIPASGPLRDELESIRKTAKTPKERTEKALELVENRVRYVALLMGEGGYVPAGAETTWSRRFGDCKAKSALLVALLRELGIDAEPVLVSTSSGDALPDRLPMVSYFNHMIVRADIGGRTYWLDGTRTGDTDIDRLVTPEYRWGLPLAANSKLVAIMPGALSAPQLETAIKIDASAGIFAPAPFKAEQTFRGDGAIAVNALYSTLSSAQLDQALRAYWRDKYDYVDIQSVNWTFDGKSAAGRLSMTGSAKMRWNDGWFSIPGSTIAYKPEFNRANGPYHDAPFAIPFPDWETTSVEVNLPDGFIPGNQQLPDPVNETLAGVHYQRIAKLNGSRLSVETSEKATQDEIPYKDALAAAPRLRSLYDDDVYLKIPSEYSATKADVAAKSAEVPTDADGYVQKGQILGSSGRFDEAIAAFSKALAITPDNSAALIGRAMALVAKGDSKGAEQDAATVEKLHPGEASAAALRGYVQLQQGEFTEAEASLTEALRARPDDTYMRLLRGQTRVQLNKGDDALSDFNAILAREPSNMSALAGRAAAYHAVGQNDRALADSDQVLKMGKADPRLRLLRANIFRDEGKHDLVVKEAELLMQENPDSDFALVAAGKIFSAEGFRDKAMRALTGALSVNRYAYIYINRAEVRAPSDYAGKMADLDEALKLEPKSPDALAAKARLLSKQRQYSQALELYDQAIAAAPDGGDTLKVERAIALYKSGRTADAKKALDEARAKATTALALNNLCWMEATADILLDSAVQSCRDALQLRPDSAGYTDSLGMALLRLGKLDEAIQAYGRAIDKAHLASSYMGRAIAYARLGDTARAQADKAEALKLNADIEAQFGGYGLEISGDQKSRVIR